MSWKSKQSNFQNLIFSSEFKHVSSVVSLFANRFLKIRIMLHYLQYIVYFGVFLKLKSSSMKWSLTANWYLSFYHMVLKFDKGLLWYGFKAHAGLLSDSISIMSALFWTI